MVLGWQPRQSRRRLVVQTRVDAGLHARQREKRNRRRLHLARQLLDLVARRVQPIDEDHPQGGAWNRIQHVRRQRPAAGASPKARAKNATVVRFENMDCLVLGQRKWKKRGAAHPRSTDCGQVG